MCDETMQKDIRAFCFECGDNTHDLSVLGEMCENCDKASMALVLIQELDEKTSIGEALNGIAARSQT